MTTRRKFFSAFGAACVGAAGVTLARNVHGAARAAPAPTSTSTSTAIPVLINSVGFLHMGGWIRGPGPHGEPNSALHVGDTVVLWDYDHSTLYVIVGTM